MRSYKERQFVFIESHQMRIIGMSRLTSSQQSPRNQLLIITQ